MSTPVDGLSIDVGFRNYNPADWRKHPDPDGGVEYENDEEREIPEDVISICGVNPFEEEQNNE